MAQSLYTMLLGLVMTGLAARAYGPVAFGLLAVAIALNLVVTPLATLGTESVVLHTLVKRRYADAVVLRTSVVLRLLASCAILAAMAMGLAVVDARSYAPEVILPLGIALVFKTGESYLPWFQATGEIPRSTVARMIAYTGTVVVRGIVLAVGLPLGIYALTYALDAALVWLALHVAKARSRTSLGRGQFSGELARMLLARSWPLILSGLAVSVYNRMDQVMLGFMLSDKADMGRYAAAVTIAEAWYFVPMAVIVARQAGVMMSHGISEDEFEQKSQALFDRAAALSVLGATGVLIGSPLIIRLLFGSDFVSLEAVVSAGLLALAGVFAIMGSARGPWLIAQRLEKYSLLHLSIGAVLNVVLNLMLIPGFGIVGAAGATLVAQCVSVAVVPAVMPPTRTSVLYMGRAMHPRRWARLAANTRLLRGSHRG